MLCVQFPYITATTQYIPHTNICTHEYNNPKNTILRLRYTLVPDISECECVCVRVYPPITSDVLTQVIERLAYNLYPEA